ncbi:HupE/UreJ family protein [Granulosicoccus sp. 3-233]|uniref:HupE/UreJ family protein n=1 Tax=Granulosicoccus sp. 3-233 TaxID=3417969 RepID=UPI003D33714F
MSSKTSHNRTPLSHFRAIGKKTRHRLLFLASIALTPLSALAHHPLGGRQPETALEGLLSGIGHPVIGLDHLAFIIAAGLLAAIARRGLLIPLGFVAGSMAGVGLHLQLFTIPAVELFIAASVVLVGALLTMKQRLDVRKEAILTAVAGVFHGYAYAEAIVGANMATLASYLTGLTLVQMVMALGSYLLAARLLKGESLADNRPLRLVGLAISSIGAAFFAMAAMA